MLLLSGTKHKMIAHTSIYNDQDLTPGKFIIHKIIEQPGWFILLVLLIWLLGILDLFFMKEKENKLQTDLSYKEQKKESKSDLVNEPQSIPTIISKIKKSRIMKKIANAPVFRHIMTFKNHIGELMEKMLEEAKLQSKEKEIIKVLILYLIIRITSSILKGITVYLSIKLAAQWISQIKDAIFFKLQNLSPHYFEEKDSIGILSKSFENSISSLGTVIARGGKVSKNLVEIIITFIGFCKHSKLLGAITSLWFMTHMAMGWIYYQPARDAHSSLAYLDGKQTSFLSERLRNKHIETFLNLKEYNMKSFQEITHTMQEMIDNLAKPSALLLVCIFVLTTLLQIGLFTFILTKSDHGLTSSEKAKKAIIFVNNLFLIEAIYEISQDLPKIIENSVQIPQIFNIVNDPNNQERRRKNFEISGAAPDIEADNLSFVSGGRIIFENLSFKIPYGSKIAIVGASGSGKTSFVNMIAGLNEKYSGLITIGGKDVKEISRKSIEKKIGYIFSTQNLLSGSLRENIARGKKLSDQQLRDILKKCQLEYLLDKISIDTPLGEGEGILSSGEKKRVMIARALPTLMKKKIIIFDETLSNLDSATATQMYEMLKPYMENKTVLFIDHSGLLPKDIVFFFPKNRKVIIGKHELLMRDDEEYRTMIEASPFTKKEEITSQK